MPTVMAIDASLSMTRNFPGVRNGEELTYHQLAVSSINQVLDYLCSNSKLEFVSLISFGMQCEALVDFTRDYDLIKEATKKISHTDKHYLENLLRTVSTVLSSNWGSQNNCQVIIFTDCGVGLGATSLTNLVSNIIKNKSDPEYLWLRLLGKLIFVCIGNPVDQSFKDATKAYQELLAISGIRGHIYTPNSEDFMIGSSGPVEHNIKNSITKLIDGLCETNFKPFEASLKCGGYFKLECPVLLWPQPEPYISKTALKTDAVKMISKKLDICGFLSLSDIGSPASIGRHLVVPKPEAVQANKVTQKTTNSSFKSELTTNAFETLETDIKLFYAKGEEKDDENLQTALQNEATKESMCVLLHGALKVENMAALVLLNENWYGFIYSYADNRKKSSLMLNVLPPGHDVIPWLGDLRYLGTIEDAVQGENPSFPVKPEKRSYSQNCVVWIKQAGLQSDIQKVLRHAKKLPEKTPHFYKELNRIRRAALSLGFIELLEGIANIFEREITVLPSNTSPDCMIQLKHAAMELRKIANRDLKTLITARPTEYNQLQ